MPTNPKHPVKAVVEPMESRILYSADLGLLATAGAWHAGSLEQDVSVRLTNDIHAASVSGTEQSQRSHELVFIDGSVQGAVSIAEQIVKGSSVERNLEVIVIDPGRDGISQITNALQSRHDIDAVHMISHGDPGEIQIGGTRLNSSDLLARGTEISQWGKSLASGADILLYGCDVAAGEAGRNFVNGLSVLTGADVNASTDLTGESTEGGNWVLEYATGHIQTPLALDAATEAQFHGVLATYSVTTTADSGAGSLRQAILDANANAGTDTITFSIGSGLQTIALSSELPGITDTVSLDATTQGGYAGTPVIELNGTSAGAGKYGFKLLGAGASGSTIRGFVIDQFDAGGVLSYSASNVTIAGNYIGTNTAGTAASANGDGIYVHFGSNNTIGGGAATDRNVLSGNNSSGLHLESTAGNTIRGNYIGVNAAGSAAIANGYDGIYVDASDTNTIGGTTAGMGNIISGNNANGVELANGSTGNTLLSNYVGLNATGASAIANADVGIAVGGGANTIGGSAAGAGNVISGNLTFGINITGGNGHIVKGNLIGTNAAGTAAVANHWSGMAIANSTNDTVGGSTALERNVISGNGWFGLDINGATNVTISGNYIGTNAAGTGAVANGWNGLELKGSAANNTIGGTAAGAGNVVSGNSGVGIELNNSSLNLIAGNYVGVDAAGTSALGNGSDGIYVHTNSSSNTIGGTAGGAGNIVSGNGSRGVSLTAGSNNTVQGNYIGIGATGAALGNSSDGIALDQSTGDVVGGSVAGARNIVSGNNGNGIKLANSTGELVEGNYIGTNIAGTAAVANNGDGIEIDFASSGNTIGGTSAGARNVISGNSHQGMTIAGNNNTVTGNYIGTNAAGNATIGNGWNGVYIAGTGNTIGGMAAGAGNVISGNSQRGLHIKGNNTTLQGNDIGVDATGTTALANGGTGLELEGGTGMLVGGTTAAAGNVISGNSNNGITINGSNSNTIERNYIGTNASGAVLANSGNGIVLINSSSYNIIGGTAANVGNTIVNNAATGIYVNSATAVGNQILGNAIYAHAGLGIDLAPGGATANDAGDGDTGANDLQNFPVLVSAVKAGSTVIVAGSLNSTASRSYRIEFFANTSANSSGNGEGQRYLGFVNVTTDGSGNATFNTTLSASVTRGEWVSATATDLTTNDTSEFAVSVQIPVNHVPSGANNTITTLEDTAYTFSAADFGFSDTGDSSPDNLLSVKITTTPGAASLTNNGVAVNAGDFVLKTDIDAGKLVFTPAANTNGVGYASFTFQVRDDGGTLNGGVDLDPVARTLTVNVTSVNDAPSGADNTVIAQENGSHTFSAADFGFTDSNDSPANNFLSVKITTSPGAGSLTSNGAIVHTGDIVLKTDIDAGKLVFTPAANVSGAGYASFTFQVRDDGGTANGGVDLDLSPNTITVYVVPPHTLVVTNTANSGTGSLRQAITDANASAGTDTITFAITGGGSQSIALASVLPDITDTVILDATTESGYTSAPLIELNGTSVGNHSGFTLTSGASNSTIKGFVINRFNSVGIQLTGASNVTIQGNYIGTNAAGTAASANGSEGIVISNGSSNIIGGTSSSARNIISGNAHFGVSITGTSTSNTILGNYIGSNAAGAGAIANGWSGISVSGDSNIIGGMAAGAGNVISGNTQRGVYLQSAANSTIQGNFIGTDATGMTAIGNGSEGIGLTGTSTNNTIGGTTAAARNVISGNVQEGITIKSSSTSNTVLGNYIGINAAGNGALGNGVDGIVVQTNSNTVGGTAAGSKNVISGNAGVGINLSGANNNIVQGNYIGTDASGSTAIANTLDGIRFNSSASNNTIGGTTAGAGNIIANSSTARGVYAFSSTSVGNQILGNSIYNNSGLGIDLSPSGVNANDVGDADTGANNKQNYPVLTSAASGGGNTTVVGTFNSNASRTYRLEFFANTTADGTGNGEGQRYLGFVNVTTDGSGDATFNTTLSASSTRGEWVSATATDLTTNDTSEFALSIQIPINHAPSGADKTITTLEDTGYTFTASDFGFSDPGDSPADNLLSVKIATTPGAGSLTNNGVAVHAGNFVLKNDIDAGKLVFTPAANANGAGYASFTFQVRDDGGTLNGGIDLDPVARTMTVNVTSVNDAPSGTNTTVTTLEDTAYTFNAADFGFTDAKDSPANNFLSVKITTTPGMGSMTNNGVAVNAGDFVLKTDIDAGKLVFTPAANANGAGYASFTFQVRDDGGTANGGVDIDPVARTMTVNVTSVNDAPSGANKTITALEDTGYVFTAADFGFSDPNDSPANNLLAVKIATLPAAGTLTSNGAIVHAGDFILKTDIDVGKLVFTAAAHATGAGSGSFTFQVQDDGGTANGGADLDSVARTMTVNVNSVNNAPAGANKTVTTLEDAGYVFTAADFGFSDPNDAPTNNLLAVKIAALPGAGTLTSNGAIVHAGDFVLKTEIDVGKLVFTPAANANGAGYASFTFQVQDDGGTANGGKDLDPVARTMTVNVTSVNDAPAGANKTVATLEDTAYTFAAVDFGFTDASDSPANNFLSVKITTTPGAGNLTNNGVAVNAGDFVLKTDIDAGKLVFTPAANANGADYASFTFQVKDDGGTANGGADLDPVARTMTVNVTSVNDAPSGANKTITTLEDTGYVFTAADFGFSDLNDSPANNLLAVKITTLPAGGTLTNNGSAVTAGSFVPRSVIDAGKLVFTSALGNDGSDHASFTFRVQDDGGTANGGKDLDPAIKTMRIDIIVIAPIVTLHSPVDTSVQMPVSGSNPVSGSTAPVTSVVSLTTESSTATSGTSTPITSVKGTSVSTAGTSTSNPGGTSMTTATSPGTASISSATDTPGMSTMTLAKSSTGTSTGTTSGSSTTKVNQGKGLTNTDMSSFFFGINLTSFNNAENWHVEATDMMPSITIAPLEVNKFVREGSIRQPRGVTADQLTLLQRSVQSGNGPILTDSRESNSMDAPSLRPQHAFVPETVSESIALALSPRSLEVAAAISSAGAALIALKRTTLLASLLTAFPAWRRIDPLYILDNQHDKSHNEQGMDIADHLFNISGNHTLIESLIETRE